MSTKTSTGTDKRERTRKHWCPHCKRTTLHVVVSGRSVCAECGKGTTED